MVQSRYIIQLRDKLVRYFNGEELGELCFTLGLNYEDDLAGRTKKTKATNLIEHMIRRDKLPALVKRTVLVFSPREQVANLTGEAWLAFLDATYREKRYSGTSHPGTADGAVFTQGPGRILPSLSVWPEKRLRKLPENEVNALLNLLRKWIRRHHA